MPKILLIEDDAVVRTLILRLLQAEGFETLSAVDGAQGIEYARTQRPDLIICDVMMPECDGFSVIGQLCQNPETAGIPFIFLTAKADKSDRRQGMNLGADDYLTKPFKRQELLNAIAARLNRQTSVTQPYRQAMQQATHTPAILPSDQMTPSTLAAQFEAQVQAAIATAQRSNAWMVLVTLDLSGSATTVGSLAYTARLQRLNRIMTQLEETFRPTYAHCTTTRLSSDRLSLVLSPVMQPSELEQIAQTTLHRVQTVDELEGSAATPSGITPRLSLVHYPEHGQSVPQLLACVELSLQQARQSDRPLVICDAEISQRAAQRAWVVEQLPHALAHHEFQLCYQPQVHLITGKIIAGEALVRWRSPERGLILPGEFLAIAEETGHILSMGQQVLQMACQQAASWSIPGRPPLQVMINLSMAELCQPDLLSLLQQTLHHANLPPDRVVLELAEATLTQLDAPQLSQLQQIRNLGIRLCIDDMGKGLSSFKHLKHLSVEALKIDGTIVRELHEQDSSRAIANAIIALAHSLGIRAIAEEVETQAQLEVLRQIGCHAAQGFWFSPPVSPDDFALMLATDRRF